MYLEFYKLREYPFTLASDPRFLYFGASHREAMAGLLYSLRERKGVALLVGDPGTGKTTVLAAVLEMLAGGVHAQTLDSPLHATPAEVLGAIVSGFGLPAEGLGLSAMMVLLQAHLQERHRGGDCMLLVVDEAQDLNPLALEQVRLLTNLEMGGHKLLQIILSGQPELAVHLRTVNGRALHQRIAVRCHLAPLNRQETHAYLVARLERAGAQRMLFEPAAVERIQQLAQGVPRIINVVADHCLLAGFAAQASQVTRALVERVGIQLEMAPAPREASAAASTGVSPAPALAAHERRAPALQRFASGCVRWAGLAANK